MGNSNLATKIYNSVAMRRQGAIFLHHDSERTALSVGGAQTSLAQWQIHLSTPVKSFSLSSEGQDDTPFLLLLDQNRTTGRIRLALFRQQFETPVIEYDSSGDEAVYLDGAISISGNEERGQGRVGVVAVFGQEGDALLIDATEVGCRYLRTIGSALLQRTTTTEEDDYYEGNDDFGPASVNIFS